MHRHEEKKQKISVLPSEKVKPLDVKELNQDIGETLTEEKYYQLLSKYSQ